MEPVIYRNVQIPFWILMAAYGCAFVLPVLVAEGSFLDGEVYTLLGRNLSEGVGDLWRPHFSATQSVEWYEHPPLVFWILSVLFRILGDHLWVDHLYSGATLVVCGWLIVRIWRLIAKDRPDLAWLPLLMWFLNPQVTWAYSNVLLENTSTVFVLLSVFALLRAGYAREFPWGWPVVAGLAVTCACLAKGPVGLFPLAAVPLSWIVVRRPTVGRSGGITMVMSATVAASFLLLWTWPEARHGLGTYIDRQVLASLSGDRGGEVDMARWLGSLLETNLAPLGLGLVLTGIGWRVRGRTSITPTDWRTGAWLILLGLAGTLPIGLSPRQSLFYGLPAFPYFAMGMAWFTAPAVSALVEPMRPGGRAHRIWAGLAAVLLTGVLVFSASKVGTYSRDTELRSDVKTIVERVVGDSTHDEARQMVLGLCGNLGESWTLQTCILRYGRVSLDIESGDRRYLVAADGCPDPWMAEYRKVDLGTTIYHLYERRE